jgi:ubiquinone/menaquinone biosynthesis C-methylase UbiE
VKPPVNWRCLALLGGGLLAWCQLALNIEEKQEREWAWAMAREVADALGKPMLNVGCGVGRLNGHKCGDVCLDLDPRRLQVCKAPVQVLGDVRSIPYPDSYFGSALVSHVLEHLPSADDAVSALNELGRVADYVFICVPSKNSLMAWTVPGHDLWIVPMATGAVLIEERQWDPTVRALLQSIWDVKDSTEMALVGSR